MRYSILILIFIGLFGFFSKVHAQGVSLSEIVNFKVVPEVPKEGEEVYVSLTSYATDIDSAKITWRVNGKTIKSGMGEKNFYFNMGYEGQTTLSVTIATFEEGVIEKIFTFRPASVDLIWQTDGIVPPFYKGKSQFSHQNEVTVIAIPHIKGSNGAEINPKNFVYKWKKNGSVIEQASGYGKNTYTFEGPLISRNINIAVEAGVANGEGVVYGSVNLVPSDPSIILYKKDSVYGIQFQKAISGAEELKNSNELSVLAVPLFFSSKSEYNGALVFKWAVNGFPVGDDISNIQTFRQTNNVTGSSRISVAVENTQKILQFKSTNFDINFTSKNN